MTKLKRGNYVFLTYVGDHDPRHVHIFEDGKFVAKFDLDGWQVMEGRLTRKLRELLTALRREGKL